jgi:SAM-dependent methyltransferase
MRDSRILELGSGTGRFSQVLADNCQELVSVELSQAIYNNRAKDRDNVRLIKENLAKLEFVHEFDLVLCMGVLQHTSNPHRCLLRLFDYVKEDGIVAFNVYAKKPKRNWKYESREIFPKYLTVQEFGKLLDTHIDTIYDIIINKKKQSEGKQRDTLMRLTHSVLELYKRDLPYQEELEVLLDLWRQGPPFAFMNWKAVYPNATDNDLKEIIKCDLIDGIYAQYDSPMSTQQILDTLASINQYPYSINEFRNIHRCQYQTGKQINHITVTKKHGVEIT